MSEEALLTTKNIFKTFGEHRVLDDVSLSVKPRQIVTLIGPNGAGKTTLVRIALALISADKGSVIKKSKLRLGYMPQKLNIEPALPLTVRRFLQLGQKKLRKEINEIEKKLLKIQIRHLYNQQIGNLSSGELQRVLLARALLRNPELLVLDEPAQGVDLNGQSELYDLISTVKDEQGCGVLMVSHDLNLVMSTTDEVICLNKHVCCHGRPDAISNDPAYLGLFGAVEKNIAVYTHRHSHNHDCSGKILPDVTTRR